MRIKEQLFIFGVLPVLLFSCAATGFKYTYYGIKPSDQVLLGPTVAEDLPLSTCEPDDQVKGKCIVLLTAEFERLRSDVIRMQEELKHCQSPTQ